MSLVGNAIRRALGRHAPAFGPPPREPFFGTYQTLLLVFGAGIRHRQALDAARLANVARRRGVSAKSPYATAKGRIQHPPRRGRATGPGSYSEHDQRVADRCELRYWADQYHYAN